MNIDGRIATEEDNVDEAPMLHIDEDAGLGGKSIDGTRQNLNKIHRSQCTKYGCSDLGDFIFIEYNRLSLIIDEYQPVCRTPIFNGKGREPVVSPDACET